MNNNDNGQARRNRGPLIALLLCLLSAGVTILIILLIVRVAHCADPWSKADVALEASYQVLHWVDCGQTQVIVRNPDHYFERNPILGDHPGAERVYLYFAATSILHAAVTHFLPKKIRPYWEVVTIGLQGATVVNNFNLGLQVRF
jgi:hypothetical protein